MKKSEELAQNTLIIFVGTVCTKLITFLLLPLYTGILTTEEYGTVDLLTTLVSLLLPLVTFQVEQAVFRELIECRDNEKEKNKIITSSILSVLMQCGVFIIFFILVYPFIKNEYKIYLALNVVANIFCSLFLQMSRGLGDNKRYATGSFISAFSTIVFNILFLVFINLRVSGMLLGTLAGQIICSLYLFCFLRLYKYISIEGFNKRIIMRLWKYSIPLIPNALSWWIFSSSDRLIVSTVLGLSMNGILSAASKFSAAYTILYNIFDKSWTESIAIHIGDNDIEIYYNRMFNEVLKIFAAILFVGISTMPFIYRIMINVNYSYGYNLVPILLIAAFFNVIQGLIAVIYIAKKDTKSIAKTSFAAACINIIIHLGLIKFIGLYAAVVSTLGAYFIIAIYRFWDIRKKYMKVKFDKKLMISVIVVISVELPLYYLNNLYLNIFSIIFSVCSVLVLNRNSFKYVKELFLKRISSKIKS